LSKISKLINLSKRLPPSATKWPEQEITAKQKIAGTASNYIKCIWTLLSFIDNRIDYLNDRHEKLMSSLSDRISDEQCQFSEMILKDIRRLYKYYKIINAYLLAKLRSDFKLWGKTKVGLAKDGIVFYEDNDTVKGIDKLLSVVI